MGILNFLSNRKQTAKLELNEVPLSELGELERYKRLGVEKYKFFSTLDKKTCPKCGELDGRIFSVKDAEIGVNYPPICDSCRCHVGAIFEGTSDDKNAERAARNPITNKSYREPLSMTYSEWKKKYNL